MEDLSAPTVSRRPELELLGAQLARELAGEVVDRLGGMAAAVVLACVLFARRKGKR